MSHWAAPYCLALEIARMKLEYGKRYVTKSGWITPPMFMNTPWIDGACGEDFPFYAGSPDLSCGIGQHSWDVNGRYFGSARDEADIVSKFGDSASFGVTDDEVLDAMNEQGGGFVNALHVLYRRADSENRETIKTAFAEIWSAYMNIALSKKNRGS